MSRKFFWCSQGPHGKTLIAFTLLVSSQWCCSPSSLLYTGTMPTLHGPMQLINISSMILIREVVFKLSWFPLFQLSKWTARVTFVFTYSDPFFVSTCELSKLNTAKKFFHCNGFFISYLRNLSSLSLCCCWAKNVQVALLFGALNDLKSITVVHFGLEKEGLPIRFFPPTRNYVHIYI